MSLPLERPPLSVSDMKSTVSEDERYSAYQDEGYDVILERKGSFMRPSKAGLADEDEKLCELLLTSSQPKPEHSLFDGRYEKFLSLLQGRSEARIYLDLHPLIVPSVENLSISGRDEFSAIAEGHNDIWDKSVSFFGPKPQPSHTYGFKRSIFTEAQRKKLNITFGATSYYAAREDIYFPFVTSEVIGGMQGFNLADIPNAHSMTVALRGIVDLYRKANRASEVHRRALGFSISHDSQCARIYVHYPEVDGDNTTYWLKKIKTVLIDSEKEKWSCYNFSLNVCQFFAPVLLKNLKAVIDQLPDPNVPASELASSDVGMTSLQDDTSASKSQEQPFKKPRKPYRWNTKPRRRTQDTSQELEQSIRKSSDRLDQKLKDYQRLQAKYRQAVEKYGESVKKYGKLVEKHRESVDEFGEAIEEFEESVDDYKKVAKEYGKKVEKYREAIEECGESADEDKQAVEEYGESVGRYGKRVEKYREAIEECGEVLEEFGESADEDEQAVEKYGKLVEENKQVVEECEERRKTLEQARDFE